MPANVIIMTAGLAGSSVLTGLLTRGGYWTGHETFRKKDYDTYENKRLIELNQQLFNEIGFDGHYESEFPGWVVEEIAARATQIDPAPYEAFIADCNENSPWVWKDPRLTLTIRAWARWLDLADIRFLLISREFRQSWISATLRRQVQTPDSHKVYNERIRRSIEDFFYLQKSQYLSLVYEDLILEPDNTIDKLNKFLDVKMSRDDLMQIFSGRLEKRQHGLRNYLKARAIYFKNYRDRSTLTG